MLTCGGVLAWKKKVAEVVLVRLRAASDAGD